MSKEEAKKIIDWWYALPQKYKDRNWNKVYPLMNQYPNLVHGRKKNEKRN